MSEPTQTRQDSNSLRRKLLGAGLLLLIGFVALLASSPDGGDSAAVSPEKGLRTISSSLVGRQVVEAEVRLSGILEADREVRLSVESSGRVVRTGAHVLDPVIRGQILLEIDPVPAEIAVRQAQAQVDRTESELALAMAQNRRSSSLAKREVLSQSEIDSTQSRLGVARASLASARAQLDRALDDQAKRTLTAPFSGVLRAFAPQEGEYVRAGQEVGELVDPETLILEVGLTDRDISWVPQGAHAEVFVEALPDRTFQGIARRIARAANAANRKFPVEIEVPNADGQLRPGMVAQARMELGRSTEILAVPREAVLRQLGVTSVFLSEDEPDTDLQRLRQIPIRVRPVPFRATLLEVLSGLEPGQRIATSDLRQLVDKELVALDPETNR
jgi:RND family efflux transporter MFP subunit